MRALASSVLAGVLAGVILVGPGGLGTPAHGQPSPERERARALYRAAEAAMRDGRYDDAIRDYGAAHDITRDPAFLYKLGRAHERAGRCDVALVYYRRYLETGRPTEDFARVTSARIAACGGAPARPGAEGAPSADPSPASADPSPASADPSPASADPGSQAGPSEQAPPPPGDAPLPAAVYRRHPGPWLMIGGSIAVAAVGAVLAYSADAAERDVEDLYVGLNGTPPPFNATTRARYDAAIAEGRRYERLSIASFSAAGALAAGAAIWLALDTGPRTTPQTGARGQRERRARFAVTPTMAPGGAGVSVRGRF